MAGDKYAALRAEFVAGMMSVAELARAHDTPEKPLQLAALYLHAHSVIVGAANACHSCPLFAPVARFLCAWLCQ